MGRRPELRSERGATIITIALTMTGLMGVSSLSIDGGRLFAARRQTQNAADSAAMAGAEALFAYQYAAATNATRDTTAVNTAVSDKLLQNGATTESCSLVDSLGAVVTSCSAADDDQLVDASGVRATGTTTHRTALAGVMGINTISATAKATASIQPLVGTASPFILCGAAHTGWNILNNDDTINLAAAQTQLINIAIEAPQIPDCGAGSSAFKGKAAPGAGIVTAGSWEGVTPGNGYSSSIANAVAGLAECPSDITTLSGTCGMIVPIAASARGTGSSTQLQIVTFAIFNITAGHGSTRYTGSFVAPADLATQGQGAYGVHCLSGNQVCLLKLAT